MEKGAFTSTVVIDSSYESKCYCSGCRFSQPVELEQGVSQRVSGHRLSRPTAQRALIRLHRCHQLTLHNGDAQELELLQSQTLLMSSLMSSLEGELPCKYGM